MKIKTIKLETFEGVNAASPKHVTRIWMVRQVTDSTEYYPKQQLNKEQVDALCAADDWKVTIMELQQR